MSSTSKTIPQLGAAGTLTGLDLVHADQNGGSVKVPLSALADYIKIAQVIVPAREPFQGVLLERTSNLTGVSFPLTVPWQNAVYDTHGAWSAGAATRITMQPGWTKGRFYGVTRMSSAGEAGTLTARILKNGAIYKFALHEVTREGTVGFTDNLTWALTPVIDVVANDYFEFYINKSGMASVTSVLFAESTFFAFEVVERTGVSAGSDPDQVKFLVFDQSQSVDASAPGNYCVLRSGSGWTATRNITFNGATPARGRMTISNNSGQTINLLNGTNSPLDFTVPFALLPNEFVELVVNPSTNKLIRIVRGGG